MTARLGLCVLFALCCCYTDVKSYRIPNRIVLTFALLALALHGVQAGGAGVVRALGGFALALPLFAFFALRMLGAGDVKAMMTVGLILGWPLALRGLLYSLLCAGGAALGVLLTRRNWRERMGRLWQWMKLCFYSRAPVPYGGWESSGHFRFSFGILAGALVLAAEELLR